MWQSDAYLFEFMYGGSMEYGRMDDGLAYIGLGVGGSGCLCGVIDGVV